MKFPFVLRSSYEDQVKWTQMWADSFRTLNDIHQRAMAEFREVNRKIKELNDELENSRRETLEQNKEAVQKRTGTSGKGAAQCGVLDKEEQDGAKERYRDACAKNSETYGRGKSSKKETRVG